ncbi:MAG: DNA repair protein RecO, partial [Proteobacteria bacterium]|nr:DNA repair protein RecO [Pseudomonadota bacterium]
TLLALDGQAEFEPVSLLEAKQFMRAILRHYLGEKPLHARSLFQAGH